MYVHMHTLRIHMCMHAHTDSLTHSLTHSLTYSLTHSLTHTHSHAHTHAHTHTHTHACPLYIHMYTVSHRHYPVGVHYDLISPSSVQLWKITVHYKVCQYGNIVVCLYSMYNVCIVCVCLFVCLCLSGVCICQETDYSVL